MNYIEPSIDLCGASEEGCAISELDLLLFTCEGIFLRNM